MGISMTTFSSVIGCGVLLFAKLFENGWRPLQVKDMLPFHH